MAKFIQCFKLSGEKKEKKGAKEPAGPTEVKGFKTLKIRLERPVKPFESGELTSSLNGTTGSVSSSTPNYSVGDKVTSHERHGEDEASENAYEGEDEREDVSMKRDLSDFDLNSGEHVIPKILNSSCSNSSGCEEHDQAPNEVEEDNKKDINEIQTGHISDTGIGKTRFVDSPMLMRSCSCVETSKALRKDADQFMLSRSQTFGESRELDEKSSNPASPLSLTSHRSADRVMLKKHSSSQVLPSRIRKLWWKLFLWSHRNLHRPWTQKPAPQVVTASNQQSGYTSDTVEINRAVVLSNLESPGSFTVESLNRGCNNINSNNNHADDNQSWDEFRGRSSGLWPSKQWVAFSMETSPAARVNEWVKHLDTCNDDIDDCIGTSGAGLVFPPSPETGGSPARGDTSLTRRPDNNLSEEILHANALIQSLNASSTVAHISGIGLKALPTISCFTSLRSVNLSNNFIVHITAGSLPKGLHILDLSRNKISSIEGLRELQRLRVLNLSYNRISRIEQGLSNCTKIKELYLAGNKISNVEGLHRLLKLTVVDLSFNKITTTTALGQLVANYNSLQALNLLGNPIQSNISDEQLRKAVCGLLTKLVYLNKQPVKPQRAREVLTDSVAKAALRTGSGWSSRRKAAAKRGSSGSTAASILWRSNARSKEKGRGRLKSRNLQIKASSARAASSSSKVPR